MSEENLLPGIRVKKGDIQERILVCGDPFRAEALAKRLESSCCLQKAREYWTYQGKWQGIPLTICSHGVGASGAMLAFISLIKGGAKAILRLGTAGTLCEKVRPGDLVIATAAAKEDGVSNIYAPSSFPAVADFSVTAALCERSKKSPCHVHLGPIVTQGAFYGGVMPTNTELQAKAGAIALEMETAALFTAGSIYNVKTGAILAIDGNALAVLDSAESHDPDPELLKKAVSDCADIAFDALIAI